jgi:hypothetical protein
MTTNMFRSFDILIPKKSLNLDSYPSYPNDPGPSFRIVMYKCLNAPFPLIYADPLKASLPLYPIPNRNMISFYKVS